MREHRFGSGNTNKRALAPVPHWYRYLRTELIHVPNFELPRHPISTAVRPTPHAFTPFTPLPMPFAQLVIGPPGSGKSTYCDGMQQFMDAVQRKCSVVNLDPANDHTSYAPAVDVRDLITMDEIMDQEALGPNGGVLYALEELEQHFDWLEAALKDLGDDYVLFDCPGQVELFTHHSSLRNIFFRLQSLGYRVLFTARPYRH